MAAENPASVNGGPESYVGLPYLIPAKEFGVQWAKENYGTAYRTALVEGVVHKFLGRKGGDMTWEVKFVEGDGEEAVEEFYEQGVQAMEQFLQLPEGEGYLRPNELRRASLAGEVNLLTPAKRSAGEALLRLSGDGEGPARRNMRARDKGKKPMPQPEFSPEARQDSGSSSDLEKTESEEEEVPADEPGPSSGRRKRRSRANRGGDGRRKRRQRRRTATRQTADEDESEWEDDKTLEAAGNPLEAEEALDLNSPFDPKILDWQPANFPSSHNRLSEPRFTGPGASGPVGISGLRNKTPLQLILLFLPLSFWTLLVDQTNMYAQDWISQNGAVGRAAKWKPVTIRELMVWHGLCLAMALQPLASLGMYWWKGAQGAVTFPDFGRFMKQFRWEEIKRFLHLSDNSKRPADKNTREHRLWHVLPLMQQLRETFQKYWRPGQRMTCDERTVPSRHSMSPVRVYNPQKPHKFGAEIFQLCCAITYYYWDFWVYDKLPIRALMTDVPLMLAKSLPYMGHIVYLDRGFTSPELVTKLGSMGHGATGTAVTNRKGYPKNLVRMEKNSPRSAVKAAVDLDQPLCAAVWMDAQPVAFLSNCHGLRQDNTERLQKGGDIISVAAPEIAVEYNLHKDAVDQFDKMCLGAHYSLESELGSAKWWHSLYWGLWDGLLVNAWLVYSSVPREESRQSFLLELQKELLENNYGDEIATRQVSGAEFRAYRLLFKRTSDC
jgi:hypothetical protein